MKVQITCDSFPRWHQPTEIVIFQVPTLIAPTQHKLNHPHLNSVATLSVNYFPSSA